MSDGQSYLDTVHSVAARAMAQGADRPSFSTLRWKISGNCQAPVHRTVWGRPSRTNFCKTIGVGPDTKSPIWVDMEVRCRKCDPCREMRRRLWSARAKAETLAAVRTWFGTLTLSPDNHAVFLAKARHKEALQGVDFDGLPYGEQFICRHHAISSELTLFLKRVRKGVDRPLRNLIVAEAHKSGLPHYHMLLHETHPEGAVKHAALCANWRLGFSSWKLVEDARHSTYLCKYLSKSNAARVRASLRYGKDVLEHSFFCPTKKSVDNDPPPPLRSIPDSQRILDGERLDCYTSALPFWPVASE